MMSRLDVRLMGAIEAFCEGEPVAVPGRRVRALLALLALSAGETVTTDALANGIWGEDPPERVRGSLQTYVARLRSAVGAELVTTDPGGYTLRIGRDDVDLLRLGDRIEAAAEDPANERSILASALAQWREPLFGHDPSDWLERYESPAWVERRLLAVERRIDLDLGAGDHAACIVELHGLTERNPMRESLWERLLICLDRNGRTAEALDKYEELRTRLADDLGVDPSPALRAIHHDLLSKSSGQTTRSPTVTTPRQLPMDVHGFTGRAQQLEALDAAKAAIDAGQGPGVIALHGPAGVGKTTLAVRWAHRIHKEFPDGQLFLNLRGYGPGEQVTTGVAFDALLRGLGVPGSRIPMDEDERASMLRNELADRKVLLVLDNARGSEQVRPLLPGGDCLVVVTSRAQLRTLTIREGARRTPVAPMSPEESVDFLSHRLGEKSEGWNRDELVELAELCGHLPVALAVAAERASRDSRRPLGELNSQLRDRRERLNALTAWQDDPLTDVRAVFEWSYQTLDDSTARLFRLMGLHVDRQICMESAAALVGTDLQVVSRLLDRLVDGNLLSESRPGWYDIQDLIGIYAHELVHQVDAEDERDLAVRRLRSWFVRSAANARQVLNPPLFPIPVEDLVEGVDPQEFADGEQAFAWFSDHHRVLKAVVVEAASTGDHRTTYTLAPLMSAYLTMIAASSEAIPMYERAEACAAEAGVVTAQALSASYLGTFYVRIGDNERGRGCLERAQSLYERADSPIGLLNVRNNLAMILVTTGEVPKAIELYERMLDDARRLGLPHQEALVLNNLAECYRQVDRADEAVEAAEKAVAGYRAARDPFRMAGALDTLASAQVGAKSYDAAIETFGQALAHHAQTGRSSNEAVTLKRLGLAQKAIGREEEAAESWHRALRLLDEIGATDITEVSRDELKSLIEEAVG